MSASRATTGGRYDPLRSTQNALWFATGDAGPADGSRVAIAEIADRRAGAASAKIALPSPYGAAILRDGGVIDPVNTGDGVRLRLFDRDGALRGEFSFPE